MELDWFIGKLTCWTFILHEYDFDIVHRASRVNWHVDGLNWNPSSHEEDIIRGLVGMGMWIWRLYKDGMPMHTFVPYWGVLGMYLRLVWMEGIPTMLTWN
jgi:hypothetical protein